jgi:hypothetical protein
MKNNELKPIKLPGLRILTKKQYLALIERIQKLENDTNDLVRQLIRWR